MTHAHTKLRFFRKSFLKPRLTKNQQSLLMINITSSRVKVVPNCGIIVLRTRLCHRENRFWQWLLSDWFSRKQSHVRKKSNPTILINFGEGCISFAIVFYLFVIPISCQVLAKCRYIRVLNEFSNSIFSEMENSWYKIILFWIFDLFLH